MSEPSAAFLAGIDRYISFYETLTQRSLPLISDVASPDIHFVDPFNDVRGIAHVTKIFSDMFVHLENPRFEVTDRALSAQPYTVYLKWIFSGARANKSFSFAGISEVSFDIHGKVIEHIDYWDSGKHVFAHVPVVGYFIRAVQKRLRIKT